MHESKLPDLGIQMKFDSENRTMDSLIVYVGVRFTLDANADVTELEDGSEPRLRAAKRAGLQAWWGRLTDGEYYFVLIGAEIGQFGEEATLVNSISVDDLVRVGETVRPKLRAAGFEEEPALHFQFQGEY